ncbi:hypothetical protein RHSIM_Rhsim03G0213800 [Rhododendron simsii]|uniref:Protein kinase domain-containing protein n=1 Tax=Rhododendron simsii TaxID=118357 RepID=A0A834HDX8_RHOSS|nr:hypothetical protein RHSIM_Rhsim03G0213800 [Rhododendron simsii]
MGQCCSRGAYAGGSTVFDRSNPPLQPPETPPETPPPNGTVAVDAVNSAKATPATSFSDTSPWQTTYPAGLPPSPARTPRKRFKFPFPPPSPARPIISAIRKRQGQPKPPKEGTIPEENGGEDEGNLDKNFGYPKNFPAKYELGKEVGRGHFGHTCWAKGKKGELKNRPVAVKIISKAKHGTYMQLLLCPVVLIWVVDPISLTRSIVVRLPSVLPVMYEAFLGLPIVQSSVRPCSCMRMEVIQAEELVNVESSGIMFMGNTLGIERREQQATNLAVVSKLCIPCLMTTAISIEDVRREVTILKALSGHKNLVKFYDAFEDANNVYVVMELCEGGELLDRILSRGGRYTEEDAKTVVAQILSVVAYCHLQGVVHRDLKPENFLFTTKSEDAPMKVIDFGLSDFIRPDQRLNDIVGSAYYVAPEVLHRSYSLEADMWSVGVITYILLCGSRPFWARTESGIFRSVLRADPNFDDAPWPGVSAEAKDFVRRLLNKDHRKRMTAAQALTHPWLQVKNCNVPLDILIYKLVKSYVRATPLKRAAFMALSKALTEDELIYLRAQFSLLEPKNGRVSLDNFTKALTKNVTDAMKESRVADILNLMEPLYYKHMDFEEFCAAAISTYQLEALEGWEDIANTAFQYFEDDGNRRVSVAELAQELNLGPSAYNLLKDWIRSSDGRLSFLGYTKFLHGVTIRSSNTRHQ